jgi:UDP-2,3-diacylglucosamine pyrophosphatase LpxH
MIGYVISDLHIGGGDADPKLEDFFQDEAFVGFVDGVRGPDATLFINGDFIDFAQIPPYDVPVPRHLLWPESASLEKLEHACRAHGACFDALARFAQAGELVIHIGNHDLDLGWPAVQRRLSQRLGGGRVRFELRSSRWHGVHIEHGHEFTPENALEAPEVWKHRWAAPGQQAVEYLERVWGTDFMLEFYNGLERAYPFADNAKPTATVAFHGLRQRWIGGRELVRLVLFLKRRGVPWSGLSSALLGDENTVDKVVDGIDDREWQTMLETRRREDAAFEAEIVTAAATLSPDERAILAGPSAPLGVASQLPGGPSATLGLFRDDREHRAARDRMSEAGVTHVVFGHTHDVVDGELQGTLFNPGTWIPSLDVRADSVQAKLRVAGGLSLELLGDHRYWVTDRRAVEIRPNPPHTAQVRLLRI